MCVNAARAMEYVMEAKEEINLNLQFGHAGRL